jgi:hypothetical protein
LEEKSAYKVLDRKIWRYWRRWKDGVKMDVKEKVWKVVNWIWLRLVTNEHRNWFRDRTKCGQNLEYLNNSFCRGY